MKLVRFGEAGSETPGMLDADGTIRDLSGHVADITGATLDAATLDQLRGLDPASLPAVDGNVRLGACVGGIGKFMCIGLNYSDHAAETGADIPEHPILFMKATSAVVGPNDMVMLPRHSTHSDWEVELGVVIGKPCKYVSVEEHWTMSPAISWQTTCQSVTSRPSSPASGQRASPATPSARSARGLSLPMKLPIHKSWTCRWM